MTWPEVVAVLLAVLVAGTAAGTISAVVGATALRALRVVVGVAATGRVVAQ